MNGFPFYRHHVNTSPPPPRKSTSTDRIFSGLFLPRGNFYHIPRLDVTFRRPCLAPLSSAFVRLLLPSRWRYLTIVSPSPQSILSPYSMYAQRTGFIRIQRVMLSTPSPFSSLLFSPFFPHPTIFPSFTPSSKIPQGSLPLFTLVQFF